MPQTTPGRGLPIEVIENIIDNAPDGPTFLACSLVCREWLYRCRFYLFQRFSFAAADVRDVLPRLAGVEYDKQAQKWKPRHITGPPNSRPTLLPAGWFVQSLVITESSPLILSKSQGEWEIIRRLLDTVPNVREMQFIGVTEWALERYLDGVLGRWPLYIFTKDEEGNPLGEPELLEKPRMPRVQIEDLTLRHVRTKDWSSVRVRIAACSPTLRSLRINSLRFAVKEQKTEEANATGADSGDKVDHTVKFECLERLAIEAETPGHPFAEQLLKDILDTSSECLSKLTFVELPPSALPKAQHLLTTARLTITTLILHCDSFTGALVYDTTRSYSFELDISSLIRLEELHVVGVRSHSAYSAPAAAVLQALMEALRKFPYSTIKKLHIMLTTMLSYSPFKDEQWNELDDVLALPHIAARLEDFELVGAMSLAGRIRRFLPKSSERQILRLLS